MRHPFDRLDSRQLRRAFAVTATLALAIGVVLNRAGADLRTDAAPAGIVALEVAGDSATAQSIVQTWQRAGVLPAAAFSIGLDYLFLLLYASALSLGCVWAVRPMSERRVVAIGMAMAWLQWVAGALDAIENVALLSMIGGAHGLWPRVARLCALPKFCFVAAGALFIATAYAFGRWKDVFPTQLGRFGID